MMPPITTAMANADDAERLADIRVEAMRPSLQAAGRFDRDRARARFLDAFRPEDTRLILDAGVVTVSWWSGTGMTTCTWTSSASLRPTRGAGLAGTSSGWSRTRPALKACPCV